MTTARGWRAGWLLAAGCVVVIATAAGVAGTRDGAHSSMRVIGCGIQQLVVSKPLHELGAGQAGYAVRVTNTSTETCTYRLDALTRTRFGAPTRVDAPTPTADPPTIRPNGTVLVVLTVNASCGRRTSAPANEIGIVMSDGQLGVGLPAPLDTECGYQLSTHPA